MLVDWDQNTAAWNGLTNGVSPDGVEASSRVNGIIPSGAATEIDVTASVRAWAEGSPNYGWFLESTEVDGFSFASSESAQPPALLVVLDPRTIDRPCVLGSIQVPAAITLLEGQTFSLVPSFSFEGF